MRMVKLFLVYFLLSMMPVFLICMDNNDDKSDEKIEHQYASSVSDDDNTDIKGADKQKEKADHKETTESDEDTISDGVAKITINETSSKEPAKNKRFLNLKKKLQKVCDEPEHIKAQIAKEKPQILFLPGLDPKKIPTYLLEILLDKKSSLKMIDISPKRTKDLDVNTASKVTGVIQTILEKIAEALKSKADKEIKKLNIAVNEKVYSALKDEEYKTYTEKLGVSIDRKDIAKLKDDPNVKSIVFGEITIYIYPEECKSGWSTAAKVFGVLNFVVMGAGWVWGIYQQATTPTADSSACNCTITNGTSLFF